MSVVPAHELGGAANAAPTPESVWQRLSRAIDAYLAERTKSDPSYHVAPLQA